MTQTRLYLVAACILASLSPLHAIYWPSFKSDADVRACLKDAQQALSVTAAVTHHKNPKDRQTAKLSPQAQQQLLQILARAKAGRTQEDMKRVIKRERIYRHTWELTLPDKRRLSLDIHKDIGDNPDYAPIMLSKADYADMLHLFESAMKTK